MGLGCWAAMGASGVVAQVPAERPAAPPARVAPAAPAERAPEAQRARSIIGSTLMLRGGTSAGKVDDIVFSNDGHIQYLVVEENGKHVLVPWEAVKYDLGKRTVSVDIPVDQFRQVPTFARDAWPNVYDPGYQQKINGYYGLRPGQERRLERRQNRP